MGRQEWPVKSPPSGREGFLSGRVGGTGGWVRAAQGGMKALSWQGEAFSRPGCMAGDRKSRGLARRAFFGPCPRGGRPGGRPRAQKQPSKKGLKKTLRGAKKTQPNLQPPHNRSRIEQNTQKGQARVSSWTMNTTKRDPRSKHLLRIVCSGP